MLEWFLVWALLGVWSIPARIRLHAHCLRNTFRAPAHRIEHYSVLCERWPLFVTVRIGCSCGKTYFDARAPS